MKSKLAIAAIAMGAAAFLAAAPAHAQHRHHGGGWGGGWGGAGAGFVAGALLGGALASSPGYYYGPRYYEPDYAYAPAPAYGPDGAEAYCIQRLRTYDPASGTYMG